MESASKLTTKTSQPWLVVGDLNEIMFHYEQMGGKQRNEKLMSNFRQTIQNYHLRNLRRMGDMFIWSNKYRDDSFTKDRLGCVLVNSEWISLYNNLRVENLAVGNLNHRPQLVHCDNFIEGNRQKPRLFRYENSWDLDEECTKKGVDIQLNRKRSNSMAPIHKLLSFCCESIKKWNGHRRRLQDDEKTGYSSNLRISKKERILW